MRILLLLLRVRAFSFAVHRHLGEVLENYLHIHSPELKSTITRTLGGVSFGEASMWADRIKRTKKWSWTRSLHYTNIKKCSVTEQEYTGILDVLHNGIPKEHNSSFTEQQHTMFILHLLQDLVQPLHLSGRDRGGNSFSIIRNKNGRNKTTNLHALWDNEIPLTLFKSGYKIPKKVNDVSLLSIVNKNLQASCDWIFPSPEDEKNNTKFIVYEDYYDENFAISMFDDYLYYAHKYLREFFS